MKIKLLILFLSIMLLIPSFAIAAEKVGTVASQKGVVNIIRNGKIIKAKVGDQIFIFDNVETLKSARLKLRFTDDSIINIGENSKLFVKEYLEGKDDVKGHSVLNLISGTLEAISGRAKLEIHTPTAVASARGTKFYVWVLDTDSGVAVLLGEVDFLCKENPQWKELVLQGFMSTQVNGQCNVSKPFIISPDILKDLEDDTLIICGECQKPDNNGNCIPDDLQDPGLCMKCSNGSVVSDDFEDPGTCLKCQNRQSVPDNNEDPGVCYRCANGSAVPDNSEPCDDGDTCTENDRCTGGSCIGNRIPSPSNPECIQQ